MTYYFDEDGEHSTFWFGLRGLIKLVDKYKNVNLFRLRRYYDPYYYDSDHIYDPMHLVFGAKDKKSAMKVLIKEYFAKIFAEKVTLWEYFAKKYEFGEKLIGIVAEFWDIYLESVTAERIRAYFSKIFKSWNEKIPLWEYVTENYGLYFLVEFFERNSFVTKESITTDNVSELFSQIFWSWEKIPLWEYITIKYEFGKQLIKDIKEFWGITKYSITIEQIESFLVENAEHLIIDSTDLTLNPYKGLTTDSDESELPKVVEYLMRKYPKEYYKTYKIKKTDSKEYKSLDSFS